MNSDLMSPDKWGSAWEEQASGSSFKQVVKNLVLREFISLFRSFAARCLTDTPLIVELGCAPGTMLRRLHQACPAAKLSGVDYSRRGIEITEDSLRSWGLEAELTVGDIFNLVPAERADLVISCGLIEHFVDPIEALKSHVKFVRPGGLVAVTVPNLSHPVVVKCLKRYRPNDLLIHNLNIMSEQALRHAFNAVGFQDIQSGSALGPLLPAPARSGRASKIYTLASIGWNTCSALLPSSFLWPGLFWACGRVPSETNEVETLPVL